MNQVFAGATALALGLMLWVLGKKPNLSGEIDGSRIAGQRGERIALVKKVNESTSQNKLDGSQSQIVWRAPLTIKERINLRNQLFYLMDCGPEERKKAVMISDLWGHATVLPILRRGLKDSDSRVVVLAARALEKHRGVSNAPNAHKSSNDRPPRNVALMR